MPKCQDGVAVATLDQLLDLLSMRGQTVTDPSLTIGCPGPSCMREAPQFAGCHRQAWRSIRWSRRSPWRRGGKHSQPVKLCGRQPLLNLTGNRPYRFAPSFSQRGMRFCGLFAPARVKRCENDLQNEQPQGGCGNQPPQMLSESVENVDLASVWDLFNMAPQARHLDLEATGRLPLHTKLCQLPHG